MSEPNQKREYRKPQVLKIDLAAEEVLAVGCKMQGSFQSAFNQLPCVTRSCATLGS